MDVQQTLSDVRGAIAAKRVYAKPYERDGVVVIPAAKVRGGGGGGQGENGSGGPAGAGFGFGLDGQPVGAYVIRGNTVKWKPALDLNALILRTQAIALVALLLARGSARRSGRRRRWR